MSWLIQHLLLVPQLQAEIAVQKYPILNYSKLLFLTSTVKVTHNYLFLRLYITEVNRALHFFVFISF